MKWYEYYTQIRTTQADQFNWIQLAQGRMVSLRLINQKQQAESVSGDDATSFPASDFPEMLVEIVAIEREMDEIYWATGRYALLVTVETCHEHSLPTGIRHGRYVLRFHGFVCKQLPKEMFSRGDVPESLSNAILR